MNIYLKSLREEEELKDGLRILPEAKKENSRLSNFCFLPNFSPSLKLEKWYGYNPEKWGHFRNSYLHELKNKKDELKTFLRINAPQTLTILYSNYDESLSYAKVVKEYIQKIKL